MFRTRRAAVAASVVAVVLAAVVGVIVGDWIVGRRHPTEGDVRAAARSLVPPGFTVTSERLDAYKAYSFFGDKRYQVDVMAEGVGTADERLAAFRQQALRSGWQPPATDGSPYKREGISGTFYVENDALIMTAAATRDVEPSRQLTLVLLVACPAVVGLGICLAWMFVPRALLGRRRPSWQSDA